MPNNSLCLRQLYAGLLGRIRNKTFFRYVLGGGLITLINLGLYSVLVGGQVPVHWANLVALTTAKVSGFFINKFFVYRAQTVGLGNTGSEVGKYILTRSLTGVLDYVAVLILVEYLQFPVLITKYAIVALVIVANYVLMKYVVFADTKDNVNLK